jgi:hypothetical protein
MIGPRPDPLRIDLGELVGRTVASLYSSLVTRPTGRAVRIAIESQLAELDRGPAISIIDLSSVTILDFSCADEVVAKLMVRGAEGGASSTRVALFILHGLGLPHRGPIEAVLERQSLAIVARNEDGEVELLGAASVAEVAAWSALEGRGAIDAEDRDELPDEERSGLTLLAERGLAYRDPRNGTYHALSALAGAPPGPPYPSD